VLGTVVCFGAAAEILPQRALFPFVLPWDDATPGVTDLSGWLHKPAGKFGHVVATPDGHLRVGDRRIRFFGTDLSHSANFPLKPDAEKIAARMAKFGINIVRFHIMDIAHFPQALFRRDSPNTRELEPQAVDRLDYFIAQLKRNGIYVDLNLLNYRGFCAADGLPKEIEEFPRPYNKRHVPCFFKFGSLPELEREYARQLLVHRNPYTGLTYTEDPAVAFVEVCNENGLISSWRRGTLDQHAEVFKAELRRQWNDWLRKRYGSTEKLRQAWSQGEQPLGEEMLEPVESARDLGRWTLQNSPGSESTLTVTDDLPAEVRDQAPASKSVHLRVTKIGTGSWHVLLNRPGFGVVEGQSYTLTFWGKSDKARVMRLRLSQTAPPWRLVSPQLVADLTPEWQRFRFVTTASETLSKSRILIGDLGRELGAYWLARVSLRPGGIVGLPAQEQLDRGSVALLPSSLFGERTPAARRDWLRFLRETEDGYWQGMYRFLKDELKVKAPIIGTSAQYSTPNLMAKLDAVDAHAYWQHPRFLSRKRWGGPWLVHNVSMVNDAGGILARVAARRVLNRPHCSTEYGSPAPNTHCGESLLLCGAYAALQDWDYISISRYTLQVRDDYSWGSGKFRRYFDVDQHPTKMIGFIPAIAMFRRGDVQAARRCVVAPFGSERELDALDRGSSTHRVLDDSAFGIPKAATMVHRVAVATEGQTPPADAIQPHQVDLDAQRYVSDTGELTWDMSEEGRGVVTVNTAKSKAVIGYGGGKRYDLGGVVIEPGSTRQKGWSAVSLTAIEGNLASAPARILVIATGDIENTNMRWTSAEKNSVGRNWGEAPTLVEVIPARLTFPMPAGRVQAWALDERGQRKTQLSVQADAQDRAAVAIGPRSRTLWYEVIAE